MKGRIVEKKYRRVDDIDEKIKQVSLPYFHWKVLFLVLEDTSIEELTKTLNSDEKTVEESLNALLEQNILELSGGEETTIEETVSEEVDDDQEEEESVEELVEEPEEVAAEIISETEEQIDDVEEAAEEETVAELLEEVEEESEDAEELISEDEEVVEESSEQMEDVIEKEFDVDESFVEESEDEEPASEEINLEEITEIEEEKETEESEDEDGDESTDISSFIDEMSGDESGEQEEDEESEKEKQEQAPAEKPKDKTGKGFKTVLVIDDSIVIRKMVEIALEDGDYNIVTSSSGKDGLTLLDDENPDIVIVDMTLPDMSGIDLLKTVKASKGIPVIMLSGKDAPQQVENAKNEGADDFLPKPFRDDDLIEKVKNLIK